MKTTIWRIASALLISAVLALPAAQAADDFVPVRGAGVGETEEHATKEAYYFILNRALVHVAGNQAEGAVGTKFRKKFDRNFDSFRKRSSFFTITHFFNLSWSIFLSIFLRDVGTLAFG